MLIYFINGFYRFNQWTVSASPTLKNFRLGVSGSPACGKSNTLGSKWCKILRLTVHYQNWWIHRTWESRWRGSWAQRWDSQLTSWSMFSAYTSWWSQFIGPICHWPFGRLQDHTNNRNVLQLILLWWICVAKRVYRPMGITWTSILTSAPIQQFNSSVLSSGGLA